MNLVLVSSHIQYKNALEAMELLGKGSSSTLVFRFMPVKVDADSNTQVVDFPAKPKKDGILQHLFFMARLTLASLKLRNRVDNIFIGEVSARFMRYIALLVNARNTILVDDGMKSVYTFSGIAQYLHRNPITKKVLLKEINIVTEYQVAIPAGVEHKLHKVDRVERLSESCPVNEGEVWFIGQPLVEDGRLTLENYRKEVHQELSKYDKVKYFMHRRESFIREDLKDYDNVEIIENDVPFEVYISKSSLLPKEIIGFYSTALYYAFLRLPKAVQIRSAYVSVDDNVNKVYEYFAKVGIHVGHE